jgi:hypothetical protein
MRGGSLTNDIALGSAVALEKCPERGMVGMMAMQAGVSAGSSHGRDLVLLFYNYNTGWWHGRGCEGVPAGIAIISTIPFFGDGGDTREYRDRRWVAAVRDYFAARSSADFMMTRTSSDSAMRSSSWTLCSDML